MMMTNDAPQQYLTTRENSLVPTPLPTSSLDQREGALIKLLATAVVACLKDGKGNSEAHEHETLFEDHSACSNFSFDQADSTDFEQEEGS